MLAHWRRTECQAKAVRQPNDPLKILVLTSSTGGGHDSRALALRLWAESDEAKSAGLEAEVRIERPLENGSRLYGFGTWLYNAIQKTCPALHNPSDHVMIKAGSYVFADLNDSRNRDNMAVFLFCANGRITNQERKFLSSKVVLNFLTDKPR